MKRVLVLALILCMASIASATLKISVNGVVDPTEEIILRPSDYITLDITGDGQDINPVGKLIVCGPGSIDGAIVLYPSTHPDGSLSTYIDAEEYAVELGTDVPGMLQMFRDYLQLPDIMDLSKYEAVSTSPTPPPTSGKLFDEIIFHCEGPGAVTILLYDADFNLLDTQQITQLPEPMTLALMAIGGLFLRRRK